MDGEGGGAVSSCNRPSFLLTSKRRVVGYKPSGHKDLTRCVWDA